VTGKIRCLHPADVEKLLLDPVWERLSKPKPVEDKPAEPVTKTEDTTVPAPEKAKGKSLDLAKSKVEREIELERAAREEQAQRNAEPRERAMRIVEELGKRREEV
jgi:hypothetical protein